jgi:hypothetical protein
VFKYISIVVVKYVVGNVFAESGSVILGIDIKAEMFG